MWVCVRVCDGFYLSVRTLLSHSVMIKALGGTPYRTHSQPGSQLDRNCSAMQPTLRTAHTGALTHTHTYGYTLPCTLFLPCSVSFIPPPPPPHSFSYSLSPLASCCVPPRRFSLWVKSCVVFNVAPLVVCLALLLLAPLNSHQVFLLAPPFLAVCHFIWIQSSVLKLLSASTL